MGFFQDVLTLSTMGRTMQRPTDPGQDFAAMAAQLRTMNLAYELANAPGPSGGAPSDAVGGSIQVLHVGGTTGAIDADPILTVEVLVLGDDHPPVSATVPLLVPVGQLARLVPGAVLPALVSHRDPATFVVQWDGI